MSAGRDNRCFPSKIPDDLASSRLSIPVGCLGFREWFSTGGIFWKEFVRIRVVLVLRENFGATILRGEDTIIARPREEDVMGA